MPMQYNKLWKILIDKGMTKTQLRSAIKIGTATLAKLSANEYVSMDVIERLCQFLGCQPGEIMEYIPTQQPLSILDDATDESPIIDV